MATRCRVAEMGDRIDVYSTAGGVNDSQDTLVVKPSRSWKGFLWDTWEYPPDQRRLLFKVDAFILTFASLGYFLKNIDQTNVNNAFLSGMEEDLRLYGNQLVTSTSIWTVGYVIGQIPCNLLLTRISPRWMIPALEVGWGICTFCTSSVQSYQSLYAWRFLVGLFESGFYPGIHYVLGSWYTPQEIGKRAMIFWLAGSVGTMFSGFLQAARMRSIGRASKKPWTKAKLVRIFSSWHSYVLPPIYILWNNACIQAAMGYWLKSFNAKPAPLPGVSHTVADINNLPIATTGIFVPVAFIWALLADGPFRGKRWPFIFAGAVISIFFDVLLLKMPLYSNIHGRTVVYWLSNIGNGAGPLILSWINEICSDDTEKRALLVAMANDLAYVVQAVAPNFVWKTTDFPRATKGYTWAILLNVLLVLVTVVAMLLLWRDKRRAVGLPADAISESVPTEGSCSDGLREQVVINHTRDTI